ncbi:MAG: MarR family transcriptional regulator [Microbacteriaceae bacterium]
MIDRDAVAAWESLFRAQVAVMRRISADFPSREISLNEYDVLFNLSRHPDHQLRLRDLNKDVLLAQPSVSRLIDRLAARGLVNKSLDPNDRRGALISLTESGLALFRRVAHEHMESITARVAGALSPQELADLARITEKLRANV